MRVKRIVISDWRNFSNIEIQVRDNTSLVCLVGANGTGKTHILELVSACAHRIGLSSGIDIPRGDPFADETKDFLVEFYLAKGVNDSLDSPFFNQDMYGQWDRTITIEGRTTQTTAGGIPDPNHARQFAVQIQQKLTASQETHHLTLDANRAFPRQEIQSHELSELFGGQWHDVAWNKTRAFLTTRTLYGDWIKYCLALENRAANKYYQDTRRAKEEGGEEPRFIDVFSSYRQSLREVMPHLLFAGADTERKAILFDTAGLELRFDQLSGGEREIAFLIGQIDRFGLRNGIFLLDEPELHLNPDLVRSWVGYLARTVSTGQVWLATHSLEAVEAAGSDATVLLERDSTTKKVARAGSLDERPVLSSLSRAVGTPAFSIAGFRFVYIEGEEAIGERERYRRLTGLAADTRFLECGSCNEVVRRVGWLAKLAAESSQAIRVTGIVDRDWRSPSEAQLLESSGVIVLPVHEVENLYLHPETVRAIAARVGSVGFDSSQIIQEACDARAGGWILQEALSHASARNISDVPQSVRRLMHAASWHSISTSLQEFIKDVVNRSNLPPEEGLALERRLLDSGQRYASARVGADLWKVCEGKEVMKWVCRVLGFKDHLAYERAVHVYWDASNDHLPNEVNELRATLSSV